MFSRSPMLCLPQIVIPPCMNFALKHESEYETKSWIFTENAANYLNRIQNLSKVQKIETQNYLAILRMSLFLEQFEIDQEIKQHSLKNHKVKKCNVGHCFIIDVPSLTDEHSVIVPDDKVSLYHVISKTKIFAKVIKVSKKEVTIKLDGFV